MKKKRCPSFFKVLFLVAAIFFATETMAARQKITFVRERNDRAALKIDGKTYRLKVGEVTPHGIKLISVTTDEAVIMLEDIKYRYARGSSQGKPLLVRLRAKRGHWFSRGTINTKAVDFLLDTGATGVVMGEKHARDLKIRYKNAKSIKVSTASGEEKGYLIKLDSVGVGNILLNNVYAVVMRGYTDDTILLGMTFLSRVKIEYDGSDMILKQ